jgi:hypothetical protein
VRRAAPPGNASNCMSLLLRDREFEIAADTPEVNFLRFLIIAKENRQALDKLSGHTSSMNIQMRKCFNTCQKQNIPIF